MKVNTAGLNISIGTSGFSYEDWIGPVYPEGTKKGDMLSCYARELGFRIVELNYTYYTQPSARGVEGMLKNTPEDFVFVVKAHSSMTHKIRDGNGAYIRDEGAIETFFSGLAPMIDSGRLKCVLAQFPVKFSRNDGSIEHLKWFAEAMSRAPLAVELRSASWVAQSVFDLLRSLAVTYCVADCPDLPRLARFTPVLTSSMAYFRFHGRNRRWFNVPTNERYNYRYQDEELRQFLDPVRRLASMAEETLIFFNNHFQGAAVKNALKLKDLLEKT